MLNLPLGQFQCANSNPGTFTESVSANWKVFVNPEQLNRGLLVRWQTLMEMQSRHGARASDADQQAYLVQRGESRVIPSSRGSMGLLSCEEVA